MVISISSFVRNILDPIETYYIWWEGSNTSFPQQRRGFETGSGHVGFLVEKEALR
jgi:hypothetical protein